MVFMKWRIFFFFTFNFHLLFPNKVAVNLLLCDTATNFVCVIFKFIILKQLVQYINFIGCNIPIVTLCSGINSGTDIAAISLETHHRKLATSHFNSVRIDKNRLVKNFKLGKTALYSINEQGDGLRVGRLGYGRVWNTK